VKRPCGILREALLLVALLVTNVTDL